MADYTAALLLADAKKRFGEAALRNRMRGTTVTADQDAQLTEIAGGVISRVQAACQPSVGWPIPGTWPAGSAAVTGISGLDGKEYREVWPLNLLQHALDLFNWRTLSPLDEASEQARRVGKMAEQFFDDLEESAVGLGIGTGSDLSSPQVLAARARDGSSLVDGVPDRRNVLDQFRGSWWDG